jgi:hypothetical protein
MVEQILPNNNESATRIFPPKISDLNTTSVSNSLMDRLFLFFWPFFRKILSNMPLAERIQKIDPDLGATVIDAKL